MRGENIGPYRRRFRFDACKLKVAEIPVPSRRLSGHVVAASCHVSKSTVGKWQQIPSSHAVDKRNGLSELENVD